MKRLFIAINIPPEVKKRIEEIVEDLKVRFLPPENWHLTISFLGYQPDEAISPILESLKETVKIFPEPTVEFEKIIWAPPNKPARMIWLTGSKQTSKTLGVIKTKLEDELIKNGVQFQRENRLYNAHLTLARFQPSTQITRGSKILDRRVLRGSLADQRESALTFFVQSLDLMESYLKRTGAEYEILAKMDFIK